MQRDLPKQTENGTSYPIFKKDDPFIPKKLPPCEQTLFLFYQPSVELELWKQFHVFKKVRNISRFDLDKQSRIRDYHLSLNALENVKTNRPSASQICIHVIIVLLIKTQSLCDVLIGRELNEITPTENGRLDIL